MQGKEILDILSMDFFVKKYLHGIYARDQLVNLKIKFRPALLILNTDRLKGKGQHWCSIWLDTFGHLSVYFDSFGLPVDIYPEIKAFLSKNSKFTKTNKFCLQHPHSNTCGLYVIYFSKYICRGYDLDTIIAKFPLKYRCTSMNINQILYDELM